MWGVGGAGAVTEWASRLEPQEEPSSTVFLMVPGGWAARDIGPDWVGRCVSVAQGTLWTQLPA